MQDPTWVLDKAYYPVKLSPDGSWAPRRITEDLIRWVLWVWGDKTGEARLSTQPGSPHSQALHTARLSTQPGSPHSQALHTARLSTQPGSPHSHQPQIVLLSSAEPLQQ
jgi:hypothetical protein